MCWQTSHPTEALRGSVEWANYVPQHILGDEKSDFTGFQPTYLCKKNPNEQAKILGSYLLSQHSPTQWLISLVLHVLQGLLFRIELNADF